MLAFQAFRGGGSYKGREKCLGHSIGKVLRRFWLELVDGLLIPDFVVNDDWIIYSRDQSSSLRLSRTENWPAVVSPGQSRIEKSAGPDKFLCSIPLRPVER